MPNFPRYNSQARVSTQIDTRPQEVMREGAGEKLDIISKAAAETSNIIMKWSQAMDSMQETAIKSNIAVGLAQIKQESFNDPEINNEKLQIDKIKKLRQTAMGKGLQNKSLEQQLNIELDTQEQLAILEINNIYAKKKMLQDLINLDNFIQVQADNKANAPAGSIAALKADEDVHNEIQSKLASGLLTPTQAKNKWDNYRLSSVELAIMNDTAQSFKSSQVLTDLRDKQGKYAFLQDDERVKLIEKSELHIRRNKLYYDTAKKWDETQVSIDLATKLANGTLTDADIRKTVDDYPKTAAIFDNALNTKDIIEPATTGTAKYLLDLIDKVGDDKMSALDIMQSAIKNKDNFTSGEFAWFIQEATKKLEREKKGQLGWDDLTQAFINSSKGIKGFVDALVPSAKIIDVSAQLIRKLLEKVQGGKDPKVAEEEIVKEQIDQQLSNLNSEKRINVRRKSDGTEGSMLEKDFNSTIYERLK